MSNNSNKSVSKVKKNIARALLIVGLIFSIFAFVGSLGLLLLYFGLYIIAFVVIAVICLIMLLGAGSIMMVVYFIIIVIAAIFGATDFSFLGGVEGPSVTDILPMDLLEKFGVASVFYLIGLPIIVIIICVTFFSMLFAIIALSRLNHAKGKAGGVVGGIFAILSSLIGWFSLVEFAGGIMMFVVSGKEYAIDHQEEDSNIIDGDKMRLIEVK